MVIKAACLVKNAINGMQENIVNEIISCKNVSLMNKCVRLHKTCNS